MKIDYKTNAITTAQEQLTKDETAGEGFEAHGIVGIFGTISGHGRR